MLYSPPMITIAFRTSYRNGRDPPQQLNICLNIYKEHTGLNLSQFLLINLLLSFHSRHNGSNPPEPDCRSHHGVLTESRSYQGAVSGETRLGSGTCTMEDIYGWDHQQTNRWIAVQCSTV